ncbi:MAG: ParB/RepB/Spo0J family partition protein [Alphaproteobacteria bacterium]|nr:ParB/RepB/Spo0J family partition protein [Alphaproteobacteria bacterium]
MLENENNHKRKSLGRGLGALLGDDDFEEEIISSEKKATNDILLDINLIKPSCFQPRTEFNQEALNVLAQSIKEKGILQPLLVRHTENGYELIAGERRWRAAQIAGLKKVPVIEKQLEDKEVLEVALVENIVRENLSAIEEAEALQRLINEFSHTQEALSQTIGKSRSYIANTLRLLNLPLNVQNMIKEGKLTAGQVRPIIGLENAEQLAEQIIKKGLSARQVEDLVAKLKTEKQPEKKKEKRNDDVIDIEKSLNKSLGLRIKITPSKQGGGKVVLQYASPAELDMIIDILEQKKAMQPTTFVSSGAPMATAPTTNEKFSIKVID